MRLGGGGEPLPEALAQLRNNPQLHGCSRFCLTSDLWISDLGDFGTWRLGVWGEGLCGLRGECRIEGPGFRVTGLGIMADGFIYFFLAFPKPGFLFRDVDAYRFNSYRIVRAGPKPERAAVH